MVTTSPIGPLGGSGGLETVEVDVYAKYTMNLDEVVQVPLPDGWEKAYAVFNGYAVNTWDEQLALVCDMVVDVNLTGLPRVNGGGMQAVSEPPFSFMNVQGTLTWIKIQ